jgi:hypothetical protein
MYICILKANKNMKDKKKYSSAKPELELEPLLSQE